MNKSVVSEEVRYRAAQLISCVINSDDLLFYLKGIIKDYAETQEDAKWIISCCNEWLKDLRQMKKDIEDECPLN